VDFGGARNRYLKWRHAAAAMTKNRDLRVFVASGYYDLATPYSPTEYTLSNLGPIRRDDHVTVAYYEAGHMHVRASSVA